MQRLFGIIRYVNSHPSVTSWPQIIRYVTLQSRLNTARRNANIDDGEGVECLVSLANCLKKQAKELDVSAATIKCCLKKELLEELTIRYVGDISNPKIDYMDNVPIYDLCGFLVRARPSMSKCAACKSSIVSNDFQLPDDFTAADFTRLRTKGGLTFVSIPMFKCVRELELVIQGHFNDPNHFYVVDTFQVCITKMSGTHLMEIFCEEHREEMISLVLKRGKFAVSVISTV